MPRRPSRSSPRSRPRGSTTLFEGKGRYQVVDGLDELKRVEALTRIGHELFPWLMVVILLDRHGREPPREQVPPGTVRVGSAVVCPSWPRYLIPAKASAMSLSFSPIAPWPVMAIIALAVLGPTLWAYRLKMRGTGGRWRWLALGLRVAAVAALPVRGVEAGGGRAQEGEAGGVGRLPDRRLGEHEHPRRGRRSQPLGRGRGGARRGARFAEEDRRPRST